MAPDFQQIVESPPDDRNHQQRRYVTNRSVNNRWPEISSDSPHHHGPHGAVRPSCHRGNSKGSMPSKHHPTRADESYHKVSGILEDSPRHGRRKKFILYQLMFQIIFSWQRFLSHDFVPFSCIFAMSFFFYSPLPMLVPFCFPRLVLISGLSLSLSLLYAKDHKYFVTTPCKIFKKNPLLGKAHRWEIPQALDSLVSSGL